ncbi:hypothetical protein LCGC14_1004990 [marine sediment metagenome]|uniref:Uncharacterized protein n=1 Tax=marine sediment metagenome TaxID=412755 RepID=A0A0F9NNC5_9ZZZZ
MENSTVLWILSVLVVISMLLTGFQVGGLTAGNDSGLTGSEVKAIVDKALAEQPDPVLPLINLSGIEGRLDSLELEVAEFGDEDLSEEAEAERLVLAELDTRDFKKDIMKAINAFYVVENTSAEVEKYRHITDILVKDLDVDYEDEAANVTVDLKVYYYIDGDDDEEERAKIETVTFTVTDLDEDDEFEDAEVDEWSLLAVNKVY